MFGHNDIFDGGPPSIFGVRGEGRKGKRRGFTAVGEGVQRSAGGGHFLTKIQTAGGRTWTARGPQSSEEYKPQMHHAAADGAV